MASFNYQFPRPSNLPSRHGLHDEQMNSGLDNPGYEGGDSIHGAVDRHDLPQGYGPNERASQMDSSEWTTAQYFMHSRTMSEHSQATSLGTQHPDLYARRRSVPSNMHTSQYNSQSQLAQGYHMESQMVQNRSLMIDYPYQQHPTQPMPPSQFASRPITPLVIPPAAGGSIPHSVSPSRTPWYARQSSPPPSSQLGPSFPSGTPFSPHFNQGSMTVPDTSYSGSGRGAIDRTSKSSMRMHPYQNRDARQTSSMWAQMEGAGSSADLPPVASGSQIPFEGSDYATSPGADSDPYTPADTSGAMSEDLDEAAQRKHQRKVKQKVKKQGDRKRETTHLERVKELLGLKSATTKVDTLEKVITYLGGNVPPRANEPTAALPGRRDRSERAKQVSAARCEVTRLFDVLGKCMGYTDHTPPKRELLLEDVANEIERRKTQPPGPQGDGGPGGSRWLA